MKQLELELKKRLLIVEFDDAQHLENVISCHNTGIRFMSDKEEPTKLICKGSELSEEIAIKLVEELSDCFIPEFQNYRENDKGSIFTALESFISAIEAQGYYWGENPIEQPFVEKYGWYTANSQEEESGWMYEEGEEKYYEALNEWQKAKSRTFNPEKTLIFEIL